MEEKITRLLDITRQHGHGYLSPESIGTIVAAVVLADALDKIRNELQGQRDLMADLIETIRERE
jgi:hypothetical protein